MPDMNSLSKPKSDVPAAANISQAERTAISDREMLAAAIRLIVARGTQKTTLKEVGELAGYSRGLAGFRFGSKTGLFVEVLKSIGEEWLADLKIVTSGKSGLQAIAAATDAHYRFCVKAPEHVQAFYMLWFESIGPDSEFKDLINAIHERRKSDVTEWIEQGIQAGEISKHVQADRIAGQFCASIIGIVYQWLNKPEDLEQINILYTDLKQTMKLLLHADSIREPVQ